MKKWFNLFAMLFVIMAFISVSCTGQPKASYEIVWEHATDGDSYDVFIWEGQDTTTCPFAENQDYLDSTNNVSNLFVVNVDTTLTRMQLLNNGQYIVAAVVAKNSFGVYGLLTKSYALKKPITPGKAGIIRIIINP